ncbi:hypothetical protein ACFPOU_12225 [Massilia jejuensis]|uniref:Uncharacterized protein n=1 Tax=Massilia jejuensis TaxID=648894 RepID=A0ABW0PID5_9BURK
MTPTQFFRHAVLAAACAGSSLAWAALPAATPAQQQAAAAKKAAADAQAAKAKEQLAASMDALSTRWRSQAGTKGWTVHPPVTIAAAPGAAGVPAPGAAATQAPPGTPLSGAVPAAVQVTGVAITGTPMPGVAPSTTGVSANTLTGTPAGNAAASPGGGAAPRSPQALQSANVPIKSEKLGTASPSADVKKTPTGSMPAGASPSVDRGNAKEVKQP